MISIDWAEHETKYILGNRTGFAFWADIFNFAAHLTTDEVVVLDYQFDDELGSDRWISDFNFHKGMILFDREKTPIKTTDLLDAIKKAPRSSIIRAYHYAFEENKMQFWDYDQGNFTLKKHSERLILSANQRALIDFADSCLAMSHEANEDYHIHYDFKGYGNTYKSEGFDFRYLPMNDSYVGENDVDDNEEGN